MKLRCDRDLLSEALQTVQRGVSTRPGIPALTGVLMTIDAEGLALTTTDLEVTTEVKIPVEATEEGATLVPARLVADMVKSLPADAVDFESDGSRAKVVCRSFEGTLRCLAAEDFPAVRDVEGITLRVEAQAFAEGVGQVARAASRDEARPVLTGVLIEANREGVTLAATDSYRLAVRELRATGDGEARALIPERAITEAGRAASGEEKGQVELVIGDAQTAFRVGPLRMTSRLIEGEFPNYRQLLPEPGENRLSAPTSERVTLELRDGLKPALIRGEGEDAYTYLVMPVRLPAPVG